MSFKSSGDGLFPPPRARWSAAFILSCSSGCSTRHACSSIFLSLSNQSLLQLFDSLERASPELLLISELEGLNAGLSLYIFRRTSLLLAALISRRHSLVLPEEDSNPLVTGSGARLHVLDDANAGLVPAVFLNPGLFASGVSIVKTLLSARAVLIHKQKWHRCNFNDNDGCIPSKPVSQHAQYWTITVINNTCAFSAATAVSGRMKTTTHIQIGYTNRDSRLHRSCVSK